MALPFWTQPLCGPRPPLRCPSSGKALCPSLLLPCLRKFSDRFRLLKKNRGRGQQPGAPEEGQEAGAGDDEGRRGREGSGGCDRARGKGKDRDRDRGREPDSSKGRSFLGALPRPAFPGPFRQKPNFDPMPASDSAHRDGARGGGGYSTKRGRGEGEEEEEGEVKPSGGFQMPAVAKGGEKGGGLAQSWRRQRPKHDS